MTIVSPKERGVATQSPLWFLALAGVAGLSLYAFWALLRTSYYPELYRTTPEVASYLEMAWMMGCCVAIVVGLAWARRHPELWCRMVISSLPIAVASFVVATRQMLGASLQCFDPILFATAGGWTVAMWPRKA